MIDPFDGLLSDIPDGATEVPFQVVLTDLHSPKLVEVVSTLLGWEKV